MKKSTYIAAFAVLALSSLFSCKKIADYKTISTALVADAHPVDDKVCIAAVAPATSAAIKGTMLAGKTYNICSNVVVNAGDTLIIQEGVTININGNYGIGVNGVLICLGTQEHPNLITYPGVTKTDQLGANPATDPAFMGKWSGIYGSTICPMMVIKWTHVEFGGGATTGDVKAISSSAYPLFFQNPHGVFVLEDSWIYGSVDDPIRTLGGKVAIMRNTFEKCGYTGGEALNAKAGTIGDFAYNLCIGIATNGPKLSNAGAIVGVPASNMRMYNNTIINCGYRRAAAGRGGSINFEQDAAGMAYNNIIVNCKFGLRVVNNPIADTANLKYGYNLYYADSLSVANNFYPSTSVSTAISKAPVTDIPNPWTYLPVNWTVGMVYVAPTSILGANNPLFVNGPVPLPAGAKLRDVATVGTYDFHLQPGSPCVGKGYTGFRPRADVPIDPIYGATEITPPGRDLGAYQTDRTGNHH
jgi:hypothetical protein